MRPADALRPGLNRPDLALAGNCDFGSLRLHLNSLGHHPRAQSGVQCQSAMVREAGVRSLREAKLRGQQADQVQARATLLGHFDIPAVGTAHGGPAEDRLNFTMAPVGLRIPVYPIKGYSVTFRVGDGHTPRSVGGMDEDDLCAYAPGGDRLRATVARIPPKLRDDAAALIDDLDARPLRLSSQDIPTPYNGNLENLTIIQPHQIVKAAQDLASGSL